MIAPEKKEENEDERTRVGDIILEILEVRDSESEEFEQKVSEIYRRVYRKVDFSEALSQNNRIVFIFHHIIRLYLLISNILPFLLFSFSIF